MTEQVCTSIQIWECYLKPFALEHPILGWSLGGLLFFVFFVNQLSEFIPKLAILKSKLLTPIATRAQLAYLSKLAIRSDIKGRVQKYVNKFSKELPSGWLQPIEIKWVTAEQKRNFLDEGQPVIVMQPVENQDSNLVVAVYEYFKKNLFPKTKSVIPQAVLESVTLRIATRLIEDDGGVYLEAFENEVLEPVVTREKKVLKYLESYENLDAKGFFTGAFLREIHRVAEKIRFSPSREDMPKEVNDILKHMMHFIKEFDEGANKISESSWFRNGIVSSYRFLLVATPWKEEIGTSQYVNRAKMAASDGIERFYVFGSQSQVVFFDQVVQAISHGVHEYILVERFDLHSDYRGSSGGVCAVFEKRTK